MAPGCIYVVIYISSFICHIVRVKKKSNSEQQTLPEVVGYKGRDHKLFFSTDK